MKMCVTHSYCVVTGDCKVCFFWRCSG